MTHEEFVAQRTEINREIEFLKGKKKSLDKEYIESHEYYKFLNKKVKCFYTEKFGINKGQRIYKGEAYLVKISISPYRDEIIMDFNKVKKDGTMAHVSVSLSWCIDYIELAEE